MKSEIVNQVEKEVKIDWRKPQILVYDNHGVKTIVAFNGNFNDFNFEGTVLYSSFYDSLFFNASWDKRSFKPLQGSVTIEFSND